MKSQNNKFVSIIDEYILLCQHVKSFLNYYETNPIQSNAEVIVQTSHMIHRIKFLTTELWKEYRKKRTRQKSLHLCRLYLSINNKPHLFSEFLELDKKLMAGSVTNAELERYYEIIEQMDCRNYLVNNESQQTNLGII